MYIYIYKYTYIFIYIFFFFVCSCCDTGCARPVVAAEPVASDFGPTEPLTGGGPAIGRAEARSSCACVVCIA